jgi:hypothetical protein
VGFVNEDLNPRQVISWWPLVASLSLNLHSYFLYIIITSTQAQTHPGRVRGLPDVDAIESDDRCYRDAVVNFSYATGTGMRYTKHDDPAYFVGWEVCIKERSLVLNF